MKKWWAAIPALVAIALIVDRFLANGLVRRSFGEELPDWLVGGLGVVVVAAAIGAAIEPVINLLPGKTAAWLRRRNMSDLFVSLAGLGTVLLVGGLVGVWWDRSRGPILWEPHQVNVSGWEDKGVFVSQFNLVGMPRKHGSIDFTDAYIVSDLTNERIDAIIDTLGGYVPARQTSPIPTGATVRVKMLFYDPTANKHPEGQPEQEFISRWASFTLVLNYDGREYRHKITRETVQGAIDRARPRPSSPPNLPSAKKP